jgi:hypothetical protein
MFLLCVHGAWIIWLSCLHSVLRAEIKWQGYLVCLVLPHIYFDSLFARIDASVFQITALNGESNKINAGEPI